MPPEDDKYHDCSCTNPTGEANKATPVESEQAEWDMYTYQLSYVGDDGVEYTQILEATHIHTDDDHVEVWDNDILLLMVQRMSVKRIRNVSVMDMGQ